MTKITVPDYIRKDMNKMLHLALRSAEVDKQNAMANIRKRMEKFRLNNA
ncbi:MULTISPECIES: hypothetical protein [unclassified Rhizobium]